jgi:hypothetical protein
LNAVKAESAAELWRLLVEGIDRDDQIEAEDTVWLALLRDHPDAGFAVAHRGDAPEVAWLVVAAAGEDRARHRLAMRRKLPDRVRSLLATDPDETVRAAMARRRE